MSARDNWNEYHREYRRRNAEKMRNYSREQSKKFRAEHPERNKEHQNSYRLRNKEKIKLREAEYYLKNKEKIRESNRLWIKNNPEKARAVWVRRRYRLKNVKNEDYLRSEIYHRDKGLCYLCGKLINRLMKWPNPLSFSIDHVIPISSGGGNTPDNVKSSHLVCNMRKHYG